MSFLSAARQHLIGVQLAATGLLPEAFVTLSPLPFETRPRVM
jgi:hypothetical protein